ncbi:S-layer homology domain-containing protein [Anaeromicrobium sediminis]|uniref:SLH domain-containing protein n=1 Tax=Anaeromicrobium sediminis TaxID=1478221 RepID=A0A267MKE1_9FIRM|nr:S-layer homology domain-containing protein [Anaeromicrobium sediminis]PAB60054.1 hypothetical protein CCE28_06670 [Anaeromicrobium sediminis]
MYLRKIFILLLVILIVLPINVSARTKDEASSWHYGNVSDWAKPVLVSAATKEIAKDESLFINCSRNITGKEFVTLLVNLYESLTENTMKPASKVKFPDVDVTLRKAYKYELAHGIGNEKFAPDDYVTREQMAVMIYNEIKLILKRLNMAIYYSDGVPTLNFADKANVSSWAVDEVDYIFDNKIITGDGIYFNPKGNVSVEQAVAILNNVYDIYNPHFEAGGKSKAEVKAALEAINTKKFTVGDMVSFNLGYYDDAKMVSYEDGYVFRLDGVNSNTGEKRGTLVFDSDMNEQNNWYTDVDMETYVFIDKKSWYSDVGIMLRVNAMEFVNNRHSGYYICIQGNGDVRFEVYSIREGWKELEYFHTNVDPTIPNKLRVTAVGSNFTIYLNDREIGTVKDSTYSAGNVGLSAWNEYAYYYGTIVKDLD